MKLPDQSERDRFTGETGRNFSVIAPAGVGKTTAIADRVLQLARDDEHAFRAGRAPRLPNLVVVTYTRKAADELRNRARQAIVKAKLEPRVMGWFNDAFFGTIHSFCFELLRRFGPLAGLPTRFKIEKDEAALHLAFQRDTPDVAVFLPAGARAAWRRFGTAARLWTLVWSGPGGAMPPPPGIFPAVDPAPLQTFKPARKDKRVEKNIQLSLERLRRWQDAPADARALGVPEAAGGGEEFKELWAAVFHPLREWLAAAAAHGAARLAEAYAAFKESQGRLSFDDFVRQAARLLREPALAERIRNLGYSVLLDEAQDTNPAQFALLVGVAQPAETPGLWVEGAGAPPAPGRFSMVGDPQQCIFDRADVRAYLDLHRRLIESGAAEALTFSVTMRCDEEIVASVNTVFPALLDARAGQAKFVPLRARPAAGRGGVWRLVVARPEIWDEKKVAEHSRVEAARLAAWLAAAGPAGVGAADWSQVAILSPRKTPDWLGALGAALKRENLSVQVHSGEPTSGDNPARVWLATLLGVMADPADIFETVGVLREIFGISDDEIYHWRQGNVSAAARVAATVALLQKASRAMAGKPLREAVALAVEAAQLRERLAALSVPPGDFEAMLDLATLADARGDALGDFARELWRGPVEATEPVAQRGSLQVMSSHKAKGLEWPVVILFGMFREPGFADPPYPRWLPSEKMGEPPGCLYDKFHAAAAASADGSWKIALAAKRRAEFERLLYVSTTRPKQTLILMDASALATPEDSLGGILGVLPGGPAQAWWQALPVIEDDINGEERSAAQNAPVETTAPGEWPSVEFPPVALAAARARAEKFPRRVRPSTLARHEKIAAAPERSEPDLFAPPDYPEEQAPPSAAVSYGNWWHGLMENTPWREGPKAWAAHWEKKQQLAPDPARARVETARLLASPLAAKLAAPGLEFVVEMPFLWPEPGGARAFDGCVDLAAWDAAAGRWLVVDWKTDRTQADRINADAGAELLQRYGAQLEVYARVLQAVYAAPVDAFLYGTRTGVLAEL